MKPLDEDRNRDARPSLLSVLRAHYSRPATPSRLRPGDGTVDRLTTASWIVMLAAIATLTLVTIWPASPTTYTPAAVDETPSADAPTQCTTRCPASQPPRTSTPACPAAGCAGTTTRPCPAVPSCPPVTPGPDCPCTPTPSTGGAAGNQAPTVRWATQPDRPVINPNCDNGKAFEMVRVLVTDEDTAAEQITVMLRLTGDVNQVIALTRDTTMMDRLVFTGHLGPIIRGDVHEGPGQRLSVKAFASDGEKTGESPAVSVQIAEC